MAIESWSAARQTGGATQACHPPSLLISLDEAVASQQAAVAGSKQLRLAHQARRLQGQVTAGSRPASQAASPTSAPGRRTLAVVAAWAQLLANPLRADTHQPSSPVCARLWGLRCRCRLLCCRSPWTTRSCCQAHRSQEARLPGDRACRRWAAQLSAHRRLRTTSGCTRTLRASCKGPSPRWTSWTGSRPAFSRPTCPLRARPSRMRRLWSSTSLSQCGSALTAALRRRALCRSSRTCRCSSSRPWRRWWIPRTTRGKASWRC
mmetsp:Transcript_15870/g.46953  ORF Transcript_15870/g.46953 Transcript_15870/m.46953 type:complete len:263 (+) Transcript_15870:620-1408(+)